MMTANAVTKPETALSERASFSSFLDRVISERVESSGHLVPLVFRSLSKRKLEDIRGNAAYNAVRRTDDFCRQKTPEPRHPFAAPPTDLSKDREANSQQPDGPRRMTTGQYARGGGGVQKLGTHPLTGKPFTSRFRGVHRTVPTKRWEAQFRKNGKPTSLGCFDTEESAARAYDKMQMWCELHNQNTGKHAMMNFPSEHYKDDVPWLMEISQDALLMQLRKEGRAEAAMKRAQTQRAMQNTLLLPGGQKVLKDQYMPVDAEKGPLS